MTNSNNDSVLTAKRSVGLLVAVLAAVTVCMTSCHTASQVPLDDAYIWPDKNAQPAVSTPVVAEQPQAEPAQPAMEIVSQQDTTITVRIKR